MLLDRLTKFLVALRFIGLLGVLRSFSYALARSLIERRFRRRAPSRAVTTDPGRCYEANSHPGGARFRFERAELEIRFLTPDLIRITWEPGVLPLPYALARTDWPEVAVTLEADAGTWRLATDALRVEVHDDGTLRFSEPSGRVLREDQPPQRLGNEVRHQTRLRPEERVYGLGNRAHPLNLRGRSYVMWNRDPGAGHRPGDDPIYLCIPVYLSVHANGSHLVFYENSYRGAFSFDYEAEARFDGGALRYYVIPGPPARALERYTELTGRPPLPPRWALGYHQSRWSYETEADVRAVVDGFREHRMPLSAIHLDIDYMDRFRVFTVDGTRFPDLASLAGDLLSRGVRLVAILDPGVVRAPGYDVYADGRLRGVFCRLPDQSPSAAPVWPGWCEFPDFTDPKARDWWAALYPRLLDLGISGVWHDMNEPAAFAAWGDPTMLLSTRHSLDGRGGDHLEAHNLYALLENRAGYEALRALREDTRPFLLTRSGWAGVQRYAWTWTGDVAGTWGALRQTVATVLGLGLCGIAHTGPDIGGFGGSPSPELYIRWLQLAAFVPFCRTHSAKFTPPREPWRFGQPYLDIARRVLAWRYRLLPYLYTLAWDASRTGHPLVRPLFWPDAADPALWDTQDAFLLGDALLVAPVLEEGARRRRVTLPPGAWYEWPGEGIHHGPGQVVVEAPLERTPVFVRAGSIVPVEQADDGGAASLHLHVFAPQDGEGAGTLYSDAGDGHGPGRVDRFRLRRQDDGLRLTWAGEGEYAFPYERVELHLHGVTVRAATVDGAAAVTEGHRIETRRFSEAFLRA